MYIFECGVPNCFLCFRAGSNKWSCDSESDLDEAVRGKEREFPNAVSARHKDASSCQRFSLLETTLPASGCSPFVKTTTRLCSGALQFDAMAPLCAACRKTPLAGRPYPDDRNYVDHHPTADKLRAAAEKGCQMCALLWGTFSAREKSEIQKRQPFKGKGKCLLFFQFRPRGERDFDLVFTFEDDDSYFAIKSFAFTWTKGL
jgi:hypothetical protein